jgi:hypothetical protein
MFYHNSQKMSQLIILKSKKNSESRLRTCCDNMEFHWTLLIISKPTRDEKTITTKKNQASLFLGLKWARREDWWPRIELINHVVDTRELKGRFNHMLVLSPCAWSLVSCSILLALHMVVVLYYHRYLFVWATYCIACMWYLEQVYTTSVFIYTSFPTPGLVLNDLFFHPPALSIQKPM